MLVRSRILLITSVAVYIVSLLACVSDGKRRPVAQDANVNTLPGSDQGHTLDGWGMGPDGWLPTCPSDPSGRLLDDGCTVDVCHAVIRLDYLTLALKDYAVVGGPYKPITAATAEALGQKLILDKLELPANHQPEAVLSHSGQGVYIVRGMPAGDFGGFAVVSALSGEVFAGGEIVWMGTGKWWLPTQWKSVTDLKCSSVAASPATPPDVNDKASCAMGTSSSKYVESNAMDVALRLNLTRWFEVKGPFNAVAMLYTPAIGMCDPTKAEFVVFLSQKRN